MRVGGNRLPDVEHRLGKRRPRPAGVRVRCLIAVAALLVGNPAERAEVGHADRKRLPGLRHARHEERRPGNQGAEDPDELALVRCVEHPGIVPEPGGAFGRRDRFCRHPVPVLANADARADARSGLLHRGSDHADDGSKNRAADTAGDDLADDAAEVEAASRRCSLRRRHQGREDPTASKAADGAGDAVSGCPHVGVLHRGADAVPGQCSHDDIDDQLDDHFHGLLHAPHFREASPVAGRPRWQRFSRNAT